MEDIIIKSIKWGSPEYKEALELRNRILRMPLGLDIYDDDLSGEGNDIHICAYKGRELAGVLMLTHTGGRSLRMRQVAVRSDLQGKGIGKRMAEFAENLAKTEGYQEIILHSRKTSEGFYLKLGYHFAGGEFFEVGIPHVEMRKAL